MHKLLVAVDSSDNALRAVQYAAKLAGESDAVAIHLVTAHEEPRLYGEIAVYVTPEKMAELQRAHGEDILAAAEKPLVAAGIRYTKEILVGDVPAAIARCAETAGCDTIVMGTRGGTAIGNLVMGSVATKVIHLAKVPVTLVK